MLMFYEFYSTDYNPQCVMFDHSNNWLLIEERELEVDTLASGGDASVATSRDEMGSC